MKIFTNPCLSGIKLIRSCIKRDGRKYAMALLVFTAMTFSASAQSVTWTDTFTQGQIPTAVQCNNWTDFLGQLALNDFLSVTISGTFDETGIKITDAAAATQLAALLNSGTEGTVVSDGHTWRVGRGCGSSCVSSGVELVVDGVGCSCSDTYAIRPHAGTINWGGINSVSCNSESQIMKLEFETGARITSSGPTSFCKGGSVVLTASTEKCSPPYAYSWSNGATTESITVTQGGNYSVAISGADGCIGASTITSVIVNDLTVAAGEDVTVCENSVQLSAVGNNNGAPIPPTVNKLCLFDAPGGADNCTFTSSLCNDGLEYITNSQFSKSVAVTNPIEIRFLLYYSPCTEVSVFRFKLNDNEIGSFEETNATCFCTTADQGQYPRTITFAESEFGQFWNDNAPNALTVEIVADNMGLALAGLAAEVISQNEVYSWSPTAGLSDASINNPVAEPAVSTIYTVTYTAGGCSASDQVEVKVGCQSSPVAICKPVSVSAGNNCEGNAEAADFDNGSTDADGDELTFTVSPAGPYAIGITDILLTVTDSQGESSTCNTTITVTDTELPVIITPEDITVANDPGLCTATLTLAEPVATDNCQVESITHDQTSDIFSEGETIVTWKVTDIHGNIAIATQKIIVTHEDPVIVSVEASRSVVAVKSSLYLTVSYTGNSVTSATVDWGDNAAVQTVNNPENIFKVWHTYDHSGFYSVTLTLRDACGATAMYVYENIVVFDPSCGFVTGGGWFYSPAGAYVQDPQATGKASFAFVIKYKKRSSSPDGNTEFQFRAGDLKFKSKDYEWLVIDDQTAVFKGSGKVNGHSGYGILISVVDEDNHNDDHHHQGNHKESSRKSKKSDRIRVKVWNRYGVVVYDTQLGSPDNAAAETKLNGGSIVIHGGKKDSNHSFENMQLVENGISYNSREASTSVYPNPFTESIKLQFYTSSKEDLNLQLLDITGRVVYNKSHRFSEDGSYTLELREGDGKSGIYLLKINQGRRVEFVRVVRK